MYEDPVISVIMGVYNEERYLRASIESILEQKFEDFEFIIVDDASDDDSVDIIQSYDDSRITLIRNEMNKGLTVSLNRALETATGMYVARQDADDLSLPERFERQVSFLDRHDEVSLVGTGAQFINDNGTVIDRRIPHCNPDFEDFLRKNQLIHGTILARRAVLEALGGYDEFFRYTQDLDLWLRLAKQHTIANIPVPLYQHRIHDEGVYFSQKDESMLYSMLSRDLATGATSDELKDELENNILSYYDYLSPSKRENFHLDLAIRYLRYGHREHALEECQKARQYSRFSTSTMLMTLLAYAGSGPTKTILWLMRRFLNLRTRILNQIRCSYEW